ncbi:MAG: cytochrome c biogenesis protein ResB, partial [Planctomycetota bacterium]
PPLMTDTSAASASGSSASTADYRLVFEATDAGKRAILVEPDGGVSEFALDGDGPHDIPLPFGGAGVIRVINQYDDARFEESLVKAPATDGENYPVVVLEAQLNGRSEEIKLAYKRPTPVAVPDPNSGSEAATDLVLLRYGPQYLQVPFEVYLEDFRKMDYPGSETAMAYESDVFFRRGENDEWKPFRIYMNNPLEEAGWKVYQASFVGDTISIFSVATDPGLIVIYPGSIILCVGIVIVFYSRRWSRGHPGISQGKAGRIDGDHGPAAA